MALYVSLPLRPFSKKPSLLSSSSSQHLKSHRRLLADFRPLCCLSTASAVSSAPARRTANYQPTIWDDNYIQSLPMDFMDEKYIYRRDMLKDQVKGLIDKEHDLIKQLELVDALCQLGLQYHFDSEIKELWSSISSSTVNINNLIENGNLHGSALLFRLLWEYDIDNASLLRWEIDASQQLPNYMKKCMLALFSTMNDIAISFSMEKELDILPCLKRTWVDLSKAYLVEAKWYHRGYNPALNEYLDNAWVSIAITGALIATYCLSDDLTIEALNDLEFYPPIIRHSCMLVRLYDDLGTSMEEIKRGDVPKSIQCYMNEKKVSEHAARDYIKFLIKNYWKKLNQEHRMLSKFLQPFKRALLDVPRSAQYFYNDRDGYAESNSETKDHIKCVIIEPIPF